MFIKPFIWLAVCLLLTQYGLYEEGYIWYAVGGFWLGQFFTKHQQQEDQEEEP